jgi:putative membrane-bound dehydrogenase-like protein
MNIQNARFWRWRFSFGGPRGLKPAALCVALLAVMGERALGQDLSPSEAAGKMTLAEGFSVDVFASEPEVRQPVSITFDDRGRLWVIQYLQYPAPAGLNPVEVDTYLRTTYDRAPEPPPHGVKGADRITICEDTDGDGRADTFKDFASGLNLASALAIGHGGVFVGIAPYLLFYPDRDRDDVPDGDPEVLLKGFGLEDAHAVINSLTWGPDGWLYGAQGSTVTANIRGVTFQQGIWRYHPVTREFELFSEGGGNTWGVDFDRHGNVIAGTNYGDVVLLHQVQGAYYQKNFGKHGALQNPYAFGYFLHATHTGFRGGHVTCGGVVYGGGSYPDSFTDKYIAANPLANEIHWHSIERKGSTFTTTHAGELVIGNDPWFRPVDTTIGPDGSLYVADWYDKRLNHVIPVDDWDRRNGRIYRISAKGTAAVTGIDVHELSSDRLVALLSEKNGWMAREGLRVFAERRDGAVIPILLKLVQGSEDSRIQLRAFWALAVSGGFTDGTAGGFLEHENEDIRAWSVRLLGDDGRVTGKLAGRLAEMAGADDSAVVRSQLACTAKRLAAEEGLAIVRALLGRDEDVSDIHIPMLIWWAIEDKADADREAVLGMFASPELWKAPMASEHIVERLGRRYAAQGGEGDLKTCGDLLAMAPDEGSLRLLIGGMERGFEGRSLEGIPEGLSTPVAGFLDSAGRDMTLTRFGLRIGLGPAHERAMGWIADEKAKEADRAGLIELVGQVGIREYLPTLERLLRESKSSAILGACLSALGRFSDDGIAEVVAGLVSGLPKGLQSRAIDVLCGRPSWARVLVRAVDEAQIAADLVVEAHLKRIALHRDETLDALVEKRWGKVRRESPQEKLNTIGKVESIMRSGRGPLVGRWAEGEQVFAKNCGVCHKMFGQGKEIGPDLTAADRKNQEFMLSNIVDPSMVIRNEYMNYNVFMKDGRLLMGLLAESTPNSVTILDAEDKRTVLARGEIEELRPSQVSLMPEGLLEAFEAQDIRDLFHFLQSDGPPKSE